MYHFCVCDGGIEIVHRPVHVEKDEWPDERGHENEQNVAREEFEGAYLIRTPKYAHLDEFEQTEECGD